MTRKPGGPITGRRPALRTLMSAALCRAHYAIALIILHMEPGKTLAIAVFAAADAWTASRAASDKRSNRAHNLLFAIYIIFYGHTVWNYLVRQSLPLYGWRWPAGVSLFAILLVHAAWRGKTLRAVALVWGSVAVGWLMAAGSYAAVPLAAAGAATVLIAAAGVSSRAAAHRSSAAHLALTAAAALLLARLGAFYFFTDVHGAAHYSIPGTVDAVYSYAPDDPVKRIIGNTQVYSLTPGCRDGQFFLTTRKGRPGLIVFDAGTGRAFRVAKRRTGENAVANRIALDCAARIAYSALYSEGLVNEFDLSGAQPQLKRTLRLGRRHLLDIAYSPSMQRLFITDEFHSLHIVDTRSGLRTSTMRNAGKYVALNGRRLAFVGKDHIRVFNLGGDTRRVFKESAARQDDGTDQGALSSHPRKPIIYVNGFLDGQLCERRVPDLSLLRCVSLCPGLRFTAVSPDGTRVASVDNIHGRVFFVDTATMRIVSEFNVGPRARDVMFSSDGRYAYVPSAAGGFRIKTP